MDWSVIAVRVDGVDPATDLWAEGVRRFESTSGRDGPGIVDQMPTRRRMGAPAQLAVVAMLALALVGHAVTGWPTGGARRTIVDYDVVPAKHPAGALTVPPLPIGRDPYGGRHDPSSAVSSLPELVAILPYAPILPDSPLANNALFTKAWVDRFHRAAVYYGRSRVLVMLGGGGLDFTGLGRFLHRIQGRLAIVFPASSDPRYPATVRLMFGDQLVTVAGYLPTRELAAIAWTLRPADNLRPEAGSPGR